MRMMMWLGVVLLSGATLSAQSVTLAWDANHADEQVTSYRVLVGAASGVYSSTIIVAGHETRTTVANLESGREYFFALAAENEIGIGPLSAEVRAVATTPAPPPPPQPPPTTTACETTVLDWYVRELRRDPRVTDAQGYAYWVGRCSREPRDVVLAAFRNSLEWKKLNPTGPPELPPPLEPQACVRVTVNEVEVFRSAGCPVTP